MRVSRIQADENRQAVINAASRLFREHGFDGIGLMDLMKGAGLTKGAFYKQFTSKGDLAAQASKRALESSSRRWSEAAEANPEDPLGAVSAFYLSMGHRAERTDGCPIIALGSDAARQGPEVKAAFEAGIRAHLEMLAHWTGNDDGGGTGDRSMTILSTMVGAMVLSRMVNDAQLSERILQAAARGVRASSSTEPEQPGQRQ